MAARYDEVHREGLEYIDRVTSCAEEEQHRVLLEILAQNAPAEYLRRIGVSGAAPGADEEFRRQAPLTTYEDILPDVMRIANGDSSPILSGKPTCEFLTRKLIPAIADDMDHRSRFFGLQMAVMNQAMPGLDKGKALYLYFVKAESKTPGGLPARPVLTSYYRSRNFLERPHDPYTVHTSPDDAILCVDAFQSMYTQLLCGLVHRADVLRVGAVFASGLLRAVHFLEKHWRRLCRDIRTGELDAEITDGAVRAAVGRVLLRPDPELADAIQSGNAGEPDSSDLVSLVNVKVGCAYELVVTNYGGLYRYRVGDVLRVAGFKNAAPIFTFVRRKNVALSIDADKTDEAELHAAVTSAVQHLEPFGASLAEYTSYADASKIPGHYVLFWELRRDGGTTTTPVSASVFEECCLAVEQSLNSVYRQCRAADRSVGPLEIRVVSKGTFEEMMEYALTQGASINQYKSPRCVPPGAMVELLDRRAEGRYFSPKCPNWSPGNKQWRSGGSSSNEKMDE